MLNRPTTTAGIFRDFVRRAKKQAQNVVSGYVAPVLTEAKEMAREAVSTVSTAVANNETAQSIAKTASKLPGAQAVSVALANPPTAEERAEARRRVEDAHYDVMERGERRTAENLYASMRRTR